MTATTLIDCPECGGPTVAVHVGMFGPRPWCGDWDCGWQTPACHYCGSVDHVDAMAEHGVLAIPPAPADPLRKVGMYELEDGSIYLVQPTRDGDHLYARRLVEDPSRYRGRPFAWAFEPGAMALIRPWYRMPLERARELSWEYGACIICGHRLTAADSLDAGIGPVCRTYFGIASVTGS